MKEMIIPTKQLSLAIVNACAFYDMGILSRRNSKSGFSVHSCLFNRIPETVVFCFASELFLKILLSQNNLKFKYGHKLKGLFLELPKPIRDAIEARYNALLALNGRHFADQLDNISNYFDEWRYYGVNPNDSKEKSLNFGFAYQFSTILKRLVLGINKKTANWIQKIKTDSSFT